MKITFVIGIMGNGGAERVIANLSNHFVTYGWNVRIITIYGSRQDYVLNKGVVVDNIICKCPIRIIRQIERMIKIRKLISNSKTDIIISFLADVNVHVILSTFGMNKKLIVSERNDPQRDPLQSWMRKLRDYLYKFTDAIVFQTKDAKEYFDGVLKKQTIRTIIANPVKDDLPFYNEYTKSNEIISACRLNKQKNIPLLIEAFKRLVDDGVDVKLKIYGDGPERTNLQKLINSHHLETSIELCGFITDIHQKMKEALCFVISSDYEGISNSMLEALAIGIPVVATDCPVGGARMYIKNDFSGKLVPCGDAESLYLALKEIICDREKAILLGRNASKLRSLLTTENIAQEWKKFIENV